MKKILLVVSVIVMTIWVTAWANAQCCGWRCCGGCRTCPQAEQKTECQTTSYYYVWGPMGWTLTTAPKTDETTEEQADTEITTDQPAVPEPVNEEPACEPEEPVADDCACTEASECDGTCVGKTCCNCPVGIAPKPFPLLSAMRDAFRARVIEIVNEERACCQLPPLTEDTDMCADCDSHSAYMASYGFSHSFNLKGCAECIAMGGNTPEGVASMWLHSPPHRAIIMSRGTKIGYGRFGVFHTLRVR